MNLRKTAKYRDCTVRLPGVCNFNPETTVLAHLPGAGMALKQPDILAAFACSDCHAVIDGARKTDFDRDFVRMCFYEGVFRTQLVWADEGILRW